VRLAAEIAGGLAAAHAAGLVHRDLKAENVMVTPAGHAKILDFGLSRSLAPGVPGSPGSDNESLTATGTLLGTFHAMSPEQARGGEVDARSDLFSLGALLDEMLTGRPPFRGENPLDSLQKVISWQPPDLGALRPDLPAGLAELTGRLLAKRPEDRPRSASEVVRTLERIASHPGIGEPVPAASWAGSNAATVDGAPAAALSWPSSGSPRRRRWLTVAAAVLLVLAAGGAFLLRRSGQEPLRIAVLPPRVTPAGDAALGLAASGVVAAALSTLAASVGLAPLDPEQARGLDGSPVQMARSLAAHELLAVAVEGEGSRGGRVTLRRLQGSDGRVLWAATFTVPTEPRELRLLADAVAAQLRRAYPGHPVRPGVPELDVRDQDYASYLRIRQRIEEGRAPLAPELAALELITRSSPRFVEGHVQIASVALSLFQSSLDTGYLERSRDAVRIARALAPEDPRPLAAELRVALAADRPEAAEAALAALARIVPGDPALRFYAARVAESRGDLETAITELSAAVERSPSWQYLYRLADDEAKVGRIDAARNHLRELLERSPGNSWGLERLGNLELLLGDPVRAEKVYLDLLRRSPQRSYYTNLGIARSLLGRPAAALEAYKKARDLAPENTVVLLNLADAHLASEHAGEARALYRFVLARLETAGATAGLDARDHLAQAQCLAHLGRAPEAVEIAQRVLQQTPRDPEVAFMASVVYALAGDRASALVNARIALDLGVQPRWFVLAPLGPLRNDPDLQALLRRAPAR
jgi:serine/threonine-protein kinase